MESSLLDQQIPGESCHQNLKTIFEEFLGEIKNTFFAETNN